jgi:hypothetical protein
VQRNLPQCMTEPLPFLQFDWHCHWFLLCMPLEFFVWHNIMLKDLKSFPKAPVCKFSCCIHRASYWCNKTVCKCL